MKRFLSSIICLPVLLNSQVIDTVLKFPAPVSPMFYVAEGNKLYAKVNYNNPGEQERAELHVVDCANWSTRKIYDLGENEGYDGGVWSWRRNRFYYGAIANGGGDIAVIDNATDSLIKWIRPYNSFRPAYDSRDDKLYCTSMSNVAVVDCALDSVIKVIGAPFSLWGFACWDSVNDQVFVGSAWDDKVAAIDCRTDSITAVVSTGASDPAAAALYPERGKLYVSSLEQGFAVLSIDPPALEQFVNHVVSWGNWELPATVNALEDRIYLPVVGLWDSFPYGDTLLVLEGKYDSVIKRMPTYGYVEGLALAPWSNRLYVVANRNGAPNVLQVIDCHSESVLGSCVYGYYAGDIIANPAKHEIYVADQDSSIYVFRDTIAGGVTEEPGAPPGRFDLFINPNVIRPGLPLNVTLEAGGSMFGQPAALKLFDCSGRLVAQQKVMLDQPRIVLSWTPTEAPLAAGVYVLTTNAGQVRRKVVVQ